MAYGRYGSGVEFFPNVEPEYGLLYVHARGNLSIEEKDALVRQAEARILGWPSIKSVYTRVGGSAGQGGGDVAEDVVGVIQYEFVDWRERDSADAILDDLRGAMTGIPGAEVEVSVPNAGPPTGKAIQVQLSAVDPAGLDDAARAVADEAARHARRDRRLRRPAGARASTGSSRSTAPAPRSTASRPRRSAASCSW